MTLDLDIQRMVFDSELPDDEEFETWVESELKAGGREDD